MSDTRPEPLTAAGRDLLAQEAYNARSFPLITVEAIVAIEREAVERAARATPDAPAYCEIHQHYKWCEHNGGVMGPTGHESPTRAARATPDALREALDVERLARAYRNLLFPGLRDTPPEPGWVQDAQTIAREYERLTATPPAEPDR